MQKQLEALQRIGWTNTTEYLTSDYLDVYVAKSMRESWEYQSVARRPDHPGISSGYLVRLKGDAAIHVLEVVIERLGKVGGCQTLALGLVKKITTTMISRN